MSFIPCTDPCIYQQEGYCQLSRAVSAGYPSEKHACVHFLPRLGEDRECFTDVRDADTV